jgi:hypothetical protein
VTQVTKCGAGELASAESWTCVDTAIISDAHATAWDDGTTLLVNGSVSDRAAPLGPGYVSMRWAKATRPGKCCVNEWLASLGGYEEMPSLVVGSCPGDAPLLTVLTASWNFPLARPLSTESLHLCTPC